MSFLSILSISLGAILAENIVFSHLLGVTPFMENSSGIKPALRTGVAVAATSTAASVISCILDWAVISPLNLEYMRSVIYILVVAGAVQIGENVLSKKAPALYEKLSVSFPVVTANTSILGVMLLGSEGGYNIFEAIVFGLFSGLGFLAAILLFAVVRERLEYSETPKCLDGAPIAFITAGLIALAFMGFQGMRFM